MNDPKRYFLKISQTISGLRCDTFEDKDGMYVDYEDYALLKAEVERLSKPAIIGGYNLSQYIRMANSETLEFDNGDIFAEMTLPERIKYIVESHASLRSVAEDNKRECEATRIENARLKAECQARQAENSVLAVECDSLKAEVERLTKAGDELGEWFMDIHPSKKKWNAAKEGKQS